MIDSFMEYVEGLVEASRVVAPAELIGGRLSLSLQGSMLVDDERTVCDDGDRIERIGEFSSFDRRSPRPLENAFGDGTNPSLGKETAPIASL